ncbi:hypothetical protein V5T82_12355, partial [Magnetovibrio sp. PR-2]|uniref:hypothetical protein n=1 Tax=Magnetovibrio sp. PR-2 TaxID=3120356 RepID=UPI002FCDEEAC
MAPNTGWLFVKSNIGVFKTGDNQDILKLIVSNIDTQSLLRRQEPMGLSSRNNIKKHEAVR